MSSPQLFGPYMHFPKFAIILAAYMPYFFLPEIAPAATARWMMVGVGLFLLLSVLLRTTPAAQRVPIWALSVWLLVDLGVYLVGQWLTNWQGPTVWVSLFLAADGAMTAWRFYWGAFHMVGVGLILLVAPLLTGWELGYHYWSTYVGPMLAGNAFVYTFVFLGGRMSEERLEAARARTETELANTQLREYVAKIEDLAVVRERGRIAREVHDTIAHAFTGIIMQLEAVNRLLAKDPSRASAALTMVQDQARDALAEVRRSVHALRPLELEETQGIDALRTLVDKYTQKTDVQGSLRVTGQIRPLTAAQDLCLYRTVQEGLTNAFRHGRATMVHVRLHFEADRVLLTVLDNGRGPAGNQTQPGIGLLGIRERAGTLGGTVEAGKGPDGGFELKLTLPIVYTAPQEGAEVS